jgi:prepilin-type N-terminal cleavage/methylation domain-containing protein
MGDMTVKQATAVASRHRAEEGYTLIELLAALTVFAIVFAAVSFGIASALNVNRNNRSRSTAAYLATQQLELVRSNFDGAPQGLTTCPPPTPNTNDPTAVCSPVPAPYTLRQQVSWIAAGSTTSSCDVPPGSGLAYKRVTVQVTWPNMAGVAPVASQTVVTPQFGLYDTTDGHVAVQLSDRDGDPLSGQVVNLAGSTNATQRTQDGCAFFAFLTAGAYTVTPAAAGYVDRQGEQPALGTSVVGGQVTKVLATYDLAATLQITLRPPAGAFVPDGIAVTVANDHLDADTKQFAGSGSPRTVGPLFPYADGYSVWAGDCADADPVYHGGARGPILPTDPGGTSSGSADLDAVEVIVQDRNGNAVVGAQVQAVNQAGTGCSTAGRTLTSPGAVTGPGGRLLLALPYGTWRLEATGRLGTPATVTLDPVSPTIEQKVVTLS